MTSAMRAVILRSQTVRRHLSTTITVSTAVSNGKTATLLAGTAPVHSSYTIIHTRTPIQDYPPRPSSAVQRSLLAPGSLSNFAWTAEDDQDGISHPEGQDALGGESSHAQVGQEQYAITTFTKGKSSSQPEVRHIASWPTDSNEASHNATLLTHEASHKNASESKYILVCTHGSRDCRCGDTGGAVVRALREARARRQAESVGEAQTQWSNIKIMEVSHVGGHKYAANVLVYPNGDW
jgi:hypothetical protein